MYQTYCIKRCETFKAAGLQMNTVKSSILRYQESNATMCYILVFKKNTQ